MTKNWWFNFWALDPKPWDFCPVPCCDYRGGRGGNINEQVPPPGALEGIKGRFLFFILISLLEMRSTRFEARGLGGFLSSGRPGPVGTGTIIEQRGFAPFGPPTS